jgi:type VI secretion system Hcp family effector
MSGINIFLKVKLAKGGQVSGPAIMKGHEGEMLLDTIHWGEENSGVAGSRGGNLTVRNFEFTKKMCPGSVQLLLACATCDVVQEAIISCRATNASEKVDFLKWTLADGMVSHYEIDATAKDSVVPTERVSIRFRTLAVEFKPRGSDNQLQGALTARIDLAANTASS